MLRASGVAYDVRKDFPYLDYETYDFDVPVGTNGDVYDRFLVRMEEMRQIGAHPRAGRRSGCPTARSTWTIRASSCRRRRKATSEMEIDDPSLQARDGRTASAGRRGATSPVESPKGEKGYYFVSDGTASRCAGASGRPPFVNLSAIPKMVEGHLLSDVIAINASIDIVMGEIDR